jgi:Ca2+-binding RTX toxin-like protein
MATFTGTNADETITPQAVSPTVAASPAGSKPGFGADIINAGGGNDTVAAGGGADTVSLGAGNDIFTWRNGDGDDTLDGGADFDTLIFQGIDGSDQIDIRGEAVRAIVDQSGGGSVSMAGVEQVTVRPDTASDIVSIGDLRGTGVGRVEIDLGSIDVPGPDIAGDVIHAGAGDGADALTVRTENGAVVIDGLGATIAIRNQTKEGVVRDSLTLKGLGGDDTLDLSALPADTGLELYALGGEGNDTLLGGRGIESLVGGSGDDFLVGSLGADKLFGAFGTEEEDGVEIPDTGIDTVSYAKSNGAVTVSLATGKGKGGHAEGDTLTEVENLVGSAFADTLTGDGKANLLDGGADGDTMAAGAGNDTYVVDDAADRVFENAGEGIDTVIASVSHTLATNVEKLVLSGKADIDGFGNALANKITGNDGNNRIDGRAGADKLAGGKGNDEYVVDNADDVVVEAAAGGNDTVFSAIDFTLAADVENLVLIEPGAAGKIEATGAGSAGAGNALGNRIEGNGGDNLLAGKAGSDILTGGGGEDRFLFDTALDKKANVDGITDFEVSKDKIVLDVDIFAGLDLGRLDRDAFLKTNKKKPKAKDAEDRILYSKKTGAIFFDEDGKGGAKAVKFAILDDDPNKLSHKDFLIEI